MRLTIAGKRVKGIEPSCPAWEAGVLPLNYTREEFRLSMADLGFASGNSLPRNHVVRTGELAVLPERQVFSKGPRYDALPNRIGASAAISSKGIGDLIIIVSIHSDRISGTPGIVELTVASNFSFWLE